MKIDAVLPVDFNLSANATQSVEKPAAPFANWLAEGLQETNHQLLAADQALQALASGHAVSLHQTLLKMEEAKLSFQYLEQIRNRLMAAYQDLLREQI